MNVFLLHFLILTPIDAFLNLSPDYGTLRYQQPLPTLFLSSPELKTTEEDTFIKESLLENALFARMPQFSLQKLIDAYRKKEATKGEVIVKKVIA
jgi:hypothetical protein